MAINSFMEPAYWQEIVDALPDTVGQEYVSALFEERVSFKSRPTPAFVAGGANCFPS